MTLLNFQENDIKTIKLTVSYCIVFVLQVREKGRMRVHHINNVNRVLEVLEKQYNVSISTLN